MVYIPEETIKHIRSQTNIKDIVGQYVDLSKSGQNYFAHCPFHEDNTPSFSVNDQKQIFKCFSCGRGGNVFTFIQEIEEISFVESVMKVAEMSDVEIDHALKQAIEHQNQPSDSTYSKLIAIHEKAKELYQHILLNAEVGESAHDYLQERGIDREIMEEFELGYSPRQRESLELFLKTQKNLELDDDLLKNTGLFSDRSQEDESFKDRFFNRIIFPLKNHQGKTVGFSGRIFQENPESDYHTAKYLNSPETEIFNKRRILYNFDKAKKMIRQTNEVVLLEGYMDVIAAWKAGIKNSIASMGTSLTNEHIKAITNIADTLVIAFDGDSAGIESTKKIAELLTENSQLTIEIVQFPNGLDPDDYLKEQGEEAFKNLVQHGRQTLFQFLKNYYKNSFNLNNESERIKYIELLILEISKLPSAIERDMHARQLADQFDISIESIMSQVQTNKTRLNQDQVNEIQKANQKPRIKFKNESKKKTKIDVTQEKLLNRLFFYPEVMDIINKHSVQFEFSSEIYQRIFLLYTEYMSREDTIDNFMDFIKDSNTKQVISDIMWITIDIEPSEVEILDYLHYIEQIYPLEDKRQELIHEMEEVKRQGNKQREIELTNELIKLNRQLKA